MSEIWLRRGAVFETGFAHARGAEISEMNASFPIFQQRLGDILGFGRIRVALCAVD
jgi:hypothetical protein